MDYLKPIQKELKRQIAGLKQRTDLLVTESQYELIDIVKQSWLIGENANGEKLGVYSRTSKYKVSGDEFYYVFKNKLNSKPSIGNVDLILTGSLIGQTRLFEKTDGIYEIMSSDRKVESIIDRYGEEVFNISDSIKEKYLDKILNRVLNDIMNKTYALL